MVKPITAADIRKQIKWPARKDLGSEESLKMIQSTREGLIEAAVRGLAGEPGASLDVVRLVLKTAYTTPLVRAQMKTGPLDVPAAETRAEEMVKEDVLRLETAIEKAITAKDSKREGGR